MYIQSQSRIVVVDDFSVDRAFVRDLLERDVECLHLLSRPSHGGPKERPEYTLYDGNLGYVGDVVAAVKLLRTLDVDAVLAGSEEGIFFASRLCSELGLKFVWPRESGIR